MPTLNIFELRQNISKIGGVPLEIKDFCWQIVHVESVKISNVVDAQSFQLATAKVKYLLTWNLTPKCPPFNIFELSQRFRKSVEYAWRYRIFARTVYMLKVAKFQMLLIRKVFTLPLQKQNTCSSEALHPNAQPSTSSFELRERFRKSVEYLCRYRHFCLHSVQVKMWKNFKCCGCGKFSSCHCKTKISALLKLSTQMPYPETSWSWDNDFENRLNIFGDIGFLMAQCTCWKWQNFKCYRWAKFSPCHSKS